MLQCTELPNVDLAAVIKCASGAGMGRLCAYLYEETDRLDKALGAYITDERPEVQQEGLAFLRRIGSKANRPLLMYLEKLVVMDAESTAALLMEHCASAVANVLGTLPEDTQFVLMGAMERYGLCSSTPLDLEPARRMRESTGADATLMEMPDSPESRVDEAQNRPPVHASCAQSLPLPCTSSAPKPGLCVS